MNHPTNAVFYLVWHFGIATIYCTGAFILREKDLEKGPKVYSVSR